IQFKTAHRVNVNEKFSYVYLMNEDGDVNQSTLDSQQTVIEIGANDFDGKQIQLHTISIKANFSGRARILIGTHTVGSGSARFYVKEPKIEKGKATAYSRAPEDFLQMSELKITPGYWQLGSTRIDGESVSSVLRGSPDSIDAIVSEMNLTGNLNVKGQIESISLSAVRADIANLRTSILQSNVITTEHLSVSTSMVNKLFSHSARIDELLTKTHFSKSIKAMSIEAVEANIGSIRSQILTSNVIKSSHIAGGTALIDKIFSSNAMFERMMAKSGFVRTLNTVTIDTDQITIRRPDGVAVIQNGMQRFGLPVTFVQQVDGGGAGSVLIHPNYWETSARSSQTVGSIFTEHAGRWLNVGVGVGLREDADHASTKMAVVIRPNNIPSGASWPAAHIEEFIVYRGSTHYYNINVPLGRPTFGAASWTLEFYRIGENNRNPVQLRRRRIWISA